MNKNLVLFISVIAISVCIGIVVHRSFSISDLTDNYIDNISAENNENQLEPKKLEKEIIEKQENVKSVAPSYNTENNLDNDQVKQNDSSNKSSGFKADSNEQTSRIVSDRGNLRYLINDDSDFLLGLDISHYQSDIKSIEWNKVYESNVEYVFIKISEGNTYTDPFGKQHAKAAREVGIPVGGYHFARPSTPITYDAKYEANQFAKKLKAACGDYGDLPAVLDLEAPYDKDANGIDTLNLLIWADTFCNEFVSKTDHPIIIYTGNWFIEMWDDFLTNDNILVDYDLWIADYHSTRKPAGGWETWLIWQFTDKGSIEGIYGDVDLNVAKKSLLTYVK